MSAPPPGGSPPPQQPYPQPYPPQQPYYAQPAAPPPKKSNTALIILVVVVIVVVVLVAVAWWVMTAFLQPVTTNRVTVTGVSWTVNYPGTTQYFGTSPLTACTTCPITITFPTYQFQYTLTLTNSDSVRHNVTGISVSGIQFNLVSASPDPTTSSPTSINAGATQNFVLTIQASPFTGSYTLSGTVDTT